jgi:hypothetical protein
MESINFILKKDAEGRDIHLDNMSLEASKALREILDALIAIVEYEKDPNLHIGIKKGSAAQQLINENGTLQVVYNKILNAANVRPDRDNFYVAQLNVIHKNIHKTKDFEISYKTPIDKQNLNSLFVKKFKEKRDRKKDENNFNVEFITGYLELNGGKKPNFHLIGKDDSKFTIDCSIVDAQKVNVCLYSTINISAWAKSKKNGMKYDFCDIYVGNSEKYFKDLKDVIKQLKKKQGTEPFHFISEKLESYFDSKDYAGALKFIRIFKNKYALPIYLRTILVICKGFKNDPFFEETLKEIEELLSNQIGKVY